MTSIKSIESHIASDNMPGALQETITLFENHQELHEKALELSGRYHQLVKQFRLGLFTMADEIKLRKEMREELINLLNEFNK